MSIADKLSYLGETKAKFMQAMKDLGYTITSATTFREAVNLLVEEVIARELDNFDVSSLPEYWQNDVKNALAYTIMLGDGYVHHLVTTDNHYPVNYGKSAAILEVLQGTGRFGRVINLGDITHNTSNHSAAEINQMMEDYSPFAGNLLFAIGNHDSYHGDEDALFYPLIENDNSLVGSPESFNYYWDDTAHKIRYVVYNGVSDTSATHFDDDIMPWIIGIQDGWTVFVLSHYAGIPFISDFSGTPRQTTSDGLAFGKRIEDFFRNNPNKHLGGLISGHEHTDSLATLPPFDVVNQAVLSNDGHSGDAANWVKTEGTNTENTVTIMSINPTTKDVKFYRIGKQTRYGQRFGYSYAIPAPHWVEDYSINGSGVITASAPTSTYRDFFWSDLLPVYDGNNNPIKYQIYSKRSNAPLTWFAVKALDSNGQYISRPAGFSFRFDVGSFGLSYQNNSTSVQLPTGTEMFYLCAEFGDPEFDADDIVVMTDPTEHAKTYGVNFANAEWLNDTYELSFWGDNVSDTGTALARYIRVEPGKTYRLSVQNASYPYYSGKPYCAIYGTDKWLSNSIQVFKQSENAGQTMPITFTVPENVILIDISLGGATGYTNSIRLEKE